MIPVVLGVTILVFTIMYFVPGDPVKIMLGSDATEAQIQEVTEQFGLDKPYIVRLLTYLRDAFLRFDFGKSYSTRVSVTTEILNRFPRTAMLAGLNILVSILVGIPLGMFAALHHNTLADRFTMVIAVAGISIPGFWLALLLVLLFSLKLHWLPASGIGGPLYYIMPVLSVAFGGIAGMARYARSAMLEVISSDYIITARAKGISEREVIIKHALPNMLIPLITLAGNMFGAQLGGSIVVETVFSIPGLGSYMVSGINNRDYPVVQGSVIFLAIAFSLVMLITDLAYAFVDPAIKAQYTTGGRKKRRLKNAESK
jgi:peptide/nickel transport system permease protein